MKVGFIVVFVGLLAGLFIGNVRIGVGGIGDIGRIGDIGSM